MKYYVALKKKTAALYVLMRKGHQSRLLGEKKQGTEQCV